MKFQVVSKIVKDKEVLGYKLYNNFSIYYISPAVLQAAKEVDLIEEDSINKAIENQLINIGNKWGRSGEALVLDTIEKTTIDDLTLVDNGIVELKMYEFDKLVRHYKIDNEKFYLLYNGSDTATLKRHFWSVFELTDYLATHLDKQLVNIHLLGYLSKDQDGVYTINIL